MDYRLARFLRVVIIIFGAILILVLLWAAFNGIKNTFKGSKAEPPKTISLQDYQTNDSVMRYVIDGPTEAQETHEKTVVSISAKQRVVEVYIGYEKPPVLSQAFANNQAGYDAFLAALNSAGFTLVKDAQSGASRAGSCALGNRYSYQVVAANGSLSQDTWGNSCASKQGTFAGNASQVRQLFQLQIPEYNTIVSSVDD